MLYTSSELCTCTVDAVDHKKRLCLDELKILTEIRLQKGFQLLNEIAEKAKQPKKARPNGVAS